jgi:SAM-dependent methyltransferase
VSPAGDYTTEATAESLRLGEWRAMGARIKADHVAALLGRAGLRPSRVVEVGCGDGALLAELSRRGIGTAFDGFEVAAEAVDIARGRGIAGVGRIEAYDGARVPAEDDAYDLAVCSHVLEHVEAPAPIVAELARLAPVVLVEVPLEANRSARRPAKRAESTRIGHVQAFSRSDVHALLAGAGLRALGDLADPLPREHHTFFGGSPLKWAVRAAAHRVAPGLSERAFTLHYAVLAAK